MEPVRLKYSRFDYRFIIADVSLLHPGSGPVIAIERIKDSLIVAYSNYDEYVGTTKDDASHMDRLHAVIGFLNYALHDLSTTGVESLSDVTPIDIYMYEQFMCPAGEAIYAGEFLYNMACAGLLANVNPEDIIATR